MEILNKRAEEKPDVVEIVRFLIQDHAFDNEFLLTCVLEYMDRNNLKEK